MIELREKKKSKMFPERIFTTSYEFNKIKIKTTLKKAQPTFPFFEKPKQNNQLNIVCTQQIEYWKNDAFPKD